MQAIHILIATLMLLAGGHLSQASERGGTTSGVSPWAQDRINRRENPLEKRLENMIIDRVEVVDVSAGDLLRLLREKAKDADPEGRGFNMVLRASKDRLAVTLSMDLTNVPLREILKYIRLTTELDFIFERHAVVVVDKVARNQ